MAGALATTGETRVAKDAQGAGDAFRNAIISLNRPANTLGNQFVFRNGAQVCLPNVFGPAGETLSEAYLFGIP